MIFRKYKSHLLYELLRLTPKFDKYLTDANSVIKV